MTDRTMTQKSLEDLLQEAGGDPVKFMRSAKWHIKDSAISEGRRIIPQVPHEFSSWQREMLAWHETVALLDQSHHMTGVFVSGPDALKFLSQLACNKLENSTPNRAHQIICCNDQGYLIGDGILFHLEQGQFSVYGAPYVPNWIRYQAENTKLNVKVTADPTSPVYANGYGNTRPHCRYQIQGPNAPKLIEKLNGGPLGNVKFFHMTDLTIAGHKVHGLRHGMAGTMGLEVWAPWELRDEIRGAILEAGEEFGIVTVGTAAYMTSAVESGWIAGVFPAIFSADMKPYREWLTEGDVESLIRVSGSYYSDRIEDYYRTPYSMGYGHIVNLEHDFIGRDALRELADIQPPRKVTLLWDIEDACKVLAAMLNPGGGHVRCLEFPATGDKYDTITTFDKLTRGGKPVGTGFGTGYSMKERSLLTLALVDADVEHGSEVVLHWGEAGGGCGQGVVEPDEIIEVRTTVSPAPYSVVARTEYRK